MIVEEDLMMTGMADVIVTTDDTMTDSTMMTSTIITPMTNVIIRSMTDVRQLAIMIMTTKGGTIMMTAVDGDMPMTGTMTMIIGEMIIGVMLARGNMTRTVIRDVKIAEIMMTKKNHRLAMNHLMMICLL